MQFANRSRCNMLDKKILINVSDRSLAEDLTKILRALGYERTKIALSFDEAIEKANEFKPDLSILDISHAGTIKLIDSSIDDDKKIKIPSICIIDANSPKILEDEIIPEIYGFIMKPVNLACLRVSVIAALKRVEYEKKYRAFFELESDAGLLVDTSDDRIIEANSAAFALYGYSREESLIRNEIKYRTLLENLPAKIFYKDCNSVYISCNELYARDLGIAAAQIAGKTDFDFFSADLAEKHHADCMRIIETGKTEETEEDYIEDGIRRSIITTKAPVRDEKGNIHGVIGISIDNTEQKQKDDEIKKKNEEIERFTYAVSHNLKSSILTIQTFIGYLEHDMNKSDGERVKLDLDYTHNAIAKMDCLLGELLKISRMGLRLNPPVWSSLQEIVKEAVDIVAGRIIGRGVDICITDEPYFIYGDRPRLIEIFQNLIDNAVKFMGDQPLPRVEIGAYKNENKIEFFVRDNGIGIDSKYHLKIFDLFEKLDPKSEGLGMGLKIIKKIIEVHGGNIRIESDGAGLGTTFWFSLAKSKRRAA